MGRGGTMDSILASHPTAEGSVLGIAGFFLKNFLLLPSLSVAEIANRIDNNNLLVDPTHPALASGS